jgi:phage replication initiation protein
VTFEGDWRFVLPLRDKLVQAIGCPLQGHEARGLHSFEHGLQLEAFVNLRLVPFARVSWGGDRMRGRMELDISGEGCSVVADWSALRALLESLPGVRITRCDLAADMLDGEFTVDDAAAWWEAGEFNWNRRPESSCAGDWLERVRGRTLYIGKAVHGKLLRVYEKGKQLGDPSSRWVRFEVQLGNRDRVIPFDALTNCTQYFVGAYPCLARVAMAVGERIRTVRSNVDVNVVRVVRGLRASYGKWLNVLRESGVGEKQIVKVLSVGGRPGKLSGAIAASSVFAATIKAALSEGGCHATAG